MTDELIGGVIVVTIGGAITGFAMAFFIKLFAKRATLPKWPIWICAFLGLATSLALAFTIASQ